jgi:hypothetical protein
MEWHGICWRSSDVPPDEAAGARIGTVGTAGGRTPWDQREGGREACICRWWFRFCGGGGGGGPACEGGRTLRGGSPWRIRRGWDHRLGPSATLNKDR